MVIDFHTHIFPPHRAADILKDLAGRGDISHFTDGTLKGLIHSMDRSGIDISIISRITTRPERVAAVNQWLLACVTKGVNVMATVHPDLPTDVDDVKSLKKRGFVGIKMHPDYQGFFVDEERMYPFYEAAQKAMMPILFHAGLDRGLPPPVHATPDRLLKVHQRFPDLVMVAAHMGGEAVYHETENILLGSGIYLDTSYVLRLMDKATLQRFFLKHPVERFLFGSDSPFTDQLTELEYFLTLPFLSEADKEKVICTNAARLLGLGY